MRPGTMPLAFPGIVRDIRKTTPQSKRDPMKKRAETKAWTNQRIAETKAAVKAELDEGAGEDPTARLEMALKRLNDLETDTSPGGNLKRLVFIITALVQHERAGGLKPAQIRGLTRLAHVILKIHGIRPGFSSLSFLYGDLHLALSQIYRKQGQIWQSAWEQQLSMHLGRDAPAASNAPGVSALSMGIRALRLGHTHIAVAELKEADRMGLPAHLRMRARLECHKALRLAGDYEEAKALASDSKSLSKVFPVEALELEWESLCRNAQQSGDVSPIVLSVLRGKPHNQASYVCEAFLWSRTVKSRTWLQRFKRARTMARNNTINPRDQGFLWEFVQVLESCYDTDYPILVRLEELGSIIARLNLLYTIDWELLAWATAARWLFRVNSRHLAALVLNEYQALSHRVTQRRSHDALCLLGDLSDPYREPMGIVREAEDERSAG